jgi:hypothetical protein
MVQVEEQTRPSRHILFRLWQVVLSLIIAEFFKGAYRVWDQSHDSPVVVTLIACALFLSKQVIDLSLFYKHQEKEPNPYSPPIPKGHWFWTLSRTL